MDVFHKRSVVFLDKVEQVAKRLGGGLKQGELFTCFVGFGTKKGFDQLNDKLLFHAIDRLGIVSNANVMDAVDVNPGICLDGFQKRGFVFGELEQVIENDDFTRVVYGDGSFQIVERRRIVFKGGFEFGDERFAGEDIDDGYATYDLWTGL